MPAPSTPSSAVVPPAQTGELRAAVRRFIGARVRGAATAEDLTQEVFLKMQRHVAEVRDPRRLMGWVIQVARHVIADHFRRTRPTESFDEAHVAADATAPATDDREEARLRDELAAYIRCVVQGLPPIYREALELTEYDGLSQVELARRLGLSVSAAKSRVQRARALVRATVDRCCHFEVDRYGTVLDYTPRPRRCGCDGRGSGCS
ncbi:MAG: sigma-70 family RNA polymerase sigma factor [Opitutaceae bacterium]|nr:sigma-70 family RNA polymerase sigma factor [Opitutaceae bacterium]